MKKQSTLILAIIVLVLIIAGAYWLWQNNKPQPQPYPHTNQNTQGIQEPEVITSDIDTSDWQTYKNEELGFEFRYPKTWEYIVEESGQIKFYDAQKTHYLEGSETHLVSVSVRELEASFSFEEWLANWSKSRKNNGGYVKNVKINNIVAIQGIDYSGVQTIFHVDGYRYYINHVPLDFDIDEIYRAILLSWKSY